MVTANAVRIRVFATAMKAGEQLRTSHYTELPIARRKHVLLVKLSEICHQIQTSRTLSQSVRIKVYVTELRAHATAYRRFRVQIVSK